MATDLPIAYLLASGRPVELLPTRSNLALMSAAEYETYLRQRWMILRAKWAIRRDIVLGRTFEIFLEDQTGLPPVPKARSGETGPGTEG